MPIKNIAGTYEGHPYYRWRKMVNGVRWTLLCREKKDGEEKDATGWLALPEDCWTKEKSQAAANEWWRTQLALPKPDGDPEKAELLSQLDDRIGWASVERPELLPDLQEQRKRIKSLPPADLPLLDDETIAKKIEAMRFFGIEVPDDLDPVALNALFGNESLWRERTGKTKAKHPKNTLESRLDDFLRVLKNKLKPQSYLELRVYLTQVIEHLGKSLDCAKINEDTINAHYRYLASKDWQPEGKNKRLGFFRRFIKYLYEQNTLENLPRNLTSRDHRFKAIAKPVKVFKSIKEELASLPTQQKLWALLGLNCGMTQADLGALTWDMIDFERGTLTRKRVKTEARSEVPTVTYKLFPETIKLLKKLPKDSHLVFHTKKGTPLYEVRYDGDTVRKKDLFSTYWQRVAPTIPLAKYRSIAATTLRSRIEYDRFVTYFLGHAPKTQADKHYAAEDDAPFFQALAFVYERLNEPQDVEDKSKKKTTTRRRQRADSTTDHDDDSGSE